MKPLGLALTSLLLFVTQIDSQALEEIPRESSISLSSGVVDISREAALPESLTTAPARAGESDYRIIKFPGPVTRDQLEALQREVEEVYTYLPHDAFLVKVRASRPEDHLLREVGASWQGLYHPAYKLGPAVQELSRNPEAFAGEGEAAVILMVQIFPDADFDRALAKIKALGLGEVVGAQSGNQAGSLPGSSFSRVRILADPARLLEQQAALAGIPEVFWVDLEPRRVLLNDTTVWVGQSGLGGGGATPIFDQGILGEGQIVAVLDTGIDADMCYFRDPSRGLPPRNECNGGTVTDPAQRKVIAVDFLHSGECSGGISNGEWDTQDHGTHVAGTVAGDDLAGILTRNPETAWPPGPSW